MFCPGLPVLQLDSPKRLRTMFRGINLCGAESNTELPEQHRAHLSRTSNKNFTQSMPSCQDITSLRRICTTTPCRGPAMCIFFVNARHTLSLLAALPLRGSACISDKKSLLSDYCKGLAGRPHGAGFSERNVGSIRNRQTLKGVCRFLLLVYFSVVIYIRPRKVANWDLGGI